MCVGTYTISLLLVVVNLTMWVRSCVVFVTLLVFTSYAKTSYEPSIAFVCDRGAMHMEKGKGWVSDPSTDCMESKKEILDYCKKMYPSLEVTNFVEASQYQHIRGWCPLGKKCDSKEAFKVRPYRCLTGPFQSDALIVRKACHFDHVRDKNTCKDFSHWKDVAQKSCKAKNMRTESYAVLLPCGTDVFTGVEFVCCPNGEATASKDSKSESGSGLQNPVVDVKVISVDKKQDTVIDSLSVVDKYMNMKTEAYRSNEHDAFTLAKKQLVKVNHEKITKLMKEWSEAKKRVDELKKIDPKGAEKLTKEVTPRFQKEYFALQTTADSKLIQLDSVHQQHVQSNLNSKKRKAAEKLMEALQSSDQNVDDITKYLKRYISIEEKDSHHCIHHYLKIRNRDFTAAKAMLPTVIEHLSLISQRINESFGLLSIISDEVKQEHIEDKVRSWMAETKTKLDKTILKLKEGLPSKSETEKKAEKVTILSKTEEKSKKYADIKPPKLAITVVETKPSESEDSSNMYKKYAEKLAKTDFIKKNKVTDTPMNEKKDKTEHIVPPEAKMNMAKVSSLNVEANAKIHHSTPVSSAGLSLGAILAITIGVLGGFFVLIISLILVKGRSNGKRPSPNTYLEVSVEDNAMTAEARHISNMQNGYENPTYKFLENRSL